MHTLPINHPGMKFPGFKQLRLDSLKKTLNYYHLLLLVCGFCALQLAYFFGMSLQRDFNVERSILAVENRVSLDLPRLSLPNPALNIAGNPAQVREYLQKLNALLIEQNLSVRVSSLQQFDAQSQLDSAVDVAGENSHAHRFIERQLQLPGQIISLKLAICQPTLWQSASIYPLLASLLLVFLLSPYLQRKPAPVATNVAASQTRHVGLVLDLENKCIAVRGTDYKVELANKPLCFYAALLNYCQQHPGVRLSQHAILPDELLTLANQYFMRLVVLGHTIRKRPDFDANLEKMLSEIRAALDELFIDHPESKTLFYPPKALGEGSRSKMHNFALGRLSEAEWEIKGK
jgi:hypothetical protein